MGGFPELLGHAAAGFEQARQQDLSRQFADEQNRRGMAAELLGHIINDPNQSDELRQTATQSYLGLAMPSGKGTWKPMDVKSVFGPVLDHMARIRGQQQQAQQTPRQQPGPNTTTQVPTMQMGTPAQATPGQLIPLPPGVAGPPQMGMPQITGGQLNLPATDVSVRGPAQLAALPPKPSFLTGARQIAENQGYAAQQEASGQLTGQMQARSAMADRIMQDPQYADMIKQDPMMQQMLMSMKMGVQLPISYYGMMNRNVGTGGGYGKDLKAQGIPGAENLQDSQWYNMRELAGGRRTFEPGAAPGEKALGGGQLGAPGQLEAQRQQIDLPFYQKKVGMQLAKGIALQNNAFNLALQSSNYRDANSIFFKAQDDYIKRIGLQRQMETSYQDYLKTGSQQAQVQMLMAHVGMTTPVGGRVTRAAVEEAQESANRIGLNVAKWFHQDADGEYIFDGPKGGVNLTKPQMQQMLQLAKDRVAVQHDQVQTYQDQLGGGGEFTSPSMSAVRGGGKSKLSPPPPPPSSGGTKHQSFADWKKSQQGAAH